MKRTFLSLRMFESQADFQSQERSFRVKPQTFSGGACAPLEINPLGNQLVPQFDKAF